MAHCHLGVLIWLRPLTLEEEGALKLTVRQVGYENLNECKLEII